MNDDKHEPIDKDDLQGREIDAEVLVSKDSESSAQLSDTMDVQTEEEVEKRNLKGSTVETEHMEQGMQLKQDSDSENGLLLWYDEQDDTGSSSVGVQDAELHDEDTTLSSAEKSDLPTEEEEEEEATNLRDNKDQHVGQCKEESKQAKIKEDTHKDDKENIMAEEEEKTLESNEEEDLQESYKEKTTADEEEDMQEAEEVNVLKSEEEDKQESNEDENRQESNEEKTTADEDEDTQEVDEGKSTANKEENRQEAEEDDMQEDEVESTMADEDDRQESNEKKTTADEDEDTQQADEGNIMANEEEGRQESSEDEDRRESNEFEDRQESTEDEDRQESTDEKTTADEGEDSQETDERNIMANEEEDRQEAEEGDMQEDEEENIMADEEADRQESTEEKTTADEDEDMQEVEEGNITANEEEDKPGDEVGSMADEEYHNQESNEEKSTADEDEDMLEADEGNITANEEEDRQEAEDDMQVDEEENTMANEGDDRQESNEERATDDEGEDSQEADERNIVANEEEDRQEAKEDDQQEDEEENIMADEEDDRQESTDEKTTADEDEDRQEVEEGNITANEEEDKPGDEVGSMADEEYHNQESNEEKSTADEDEDMLEVEEGDITANEEEDRQESEESDKQVDEEENIMANEDDRQESNEEKTTTDDEDEDTQEADEGNVMVNEDRHEYEENIMADEEDDIQGSNEERNTAEDDRQEAEEENMLEDEDKNIMADEEKDMQMSEEESRQESKEENTNKEDIAEKSPVLGQKHRKRMPSLDGLEIKKTTPERNSPNSDAERTPPDNSGEVQTSGECQITRTSPIIGSRLKDTTGSPFKPDVTGLTAEDTCNLVITSVRGKVADFTYGNKNSQTAVDDKELASGSSDIRNNKSLTSVEKNIECVEIVSESEEENVFEECKAVVCKKCRSIWTEKVLHTIFKGSEAVTVKSKITFGAIVLINNWAHRHIQYNKETAVRNMLERADLGKNIKGLEIGDLSQWLFELMDKGKIKCCAVFDAIYKPEPIKVSLSSLKKAKGASSEAKRTSSKDQDDSEMSKKRPLQFEEEKLPDSHDFSKVPEVSEEASAKKEKKDGLADISYVQDHRSPERAQTIKEKVNETLEQKSEPDAEISRLSPRQSDEVTTEQDESLSESRSFSPETQSKAVLTDDQVSTGEEVLSEAEPSQAEEVGYVYEEDMEVSDHEEGENDQNVAATLAHRQEEDAEPDLQMTKEREMSGTVEEDSQSLLCKKLGLDLHNIDISCSSSDMKRANNGTVAKQVSVEEEVSHAHITLLKERSALHGFAMEAFDLLPFEAENFYDSVQNDDSAQRFMTNRELLTLHSIFILDAELPNAELFYQVLIQILMSRNQVLLVPDSRTLLQVLEKLRRDFNRAKVGKSYSEFLAQNWDMRNVYSAETLWNSKRGYPNNPSIRNVLSIFCLWKNIGKQLPDFYPSLAIQEMCKFTDLSSTDKLGMCVRLYARFCTFLYKENHPELAELFLDQKFTISNISVSRDALINSMKCQASENQRIEASLTSTETEVRQAMQNCTEAEKMALRSENPKTLRHFQRLLKQFEQKLDRYKDTNAELVKRIRVAEAKKEKLVNKIKDPNLKESLHELTDGLNTIYRKRKNSSLCEADQRSAKLARMESEPCEVEESTKEVIHNILAKGVKPELVRTVIQTIMKKVTGESALNLPDVFWIRKYAQDNGFQSTVS
nr:uncharacterized protein LOC113810185 [Penaeus vannamei]